MVLSIYKWDEQWLRRAAYPNKYGLPGWALSRECCCACMMLKDDFNRADSTDLGDNWDECSGDWEILNEQLVANESGIVSWLHMAGDQVGRFALYAVDIAVNTVLTIRAFYGEEATPCTATTSWKLRLTVLTSTTAKLELLDTIDSVEQTQSITAFTTGVGSYFGMTLCVGPERIDGTSTHTYGLLSCLCTDAMPAGQCARAGWWFAIENESEEVVKIEWVQYVDHYSHDASCPDCRCGCEGHCFPNVLYATLRDYHNCANQDGKQFTLTKRAESCIWEMDEETWDGCRIKLKLYSNSAREYSPPASWVLLDESSGLYFSPVTQADCDPVFLTFGGGGTIPPSFKNVDDSPDCGISGNWVCCDGDCVAPCPYVGNCQGSYYIEVTE